MAQPDLHYIQREIDSIVLCMVRGNTPIAQRTADRLIARYPKMSGNIRLAIVNQYLDRTTDTEPIGQEDHDE